MSAGIYLLQGNEGLVKMTEKSYDSEALLQELIAKYPDLLAGDQMDSSRPRRWLLIKREAELASEADGSARWSVDHLFLDQDGVPTIVEVKRSSDTRIRREVVGQMLDYAANAVLFWPVEEIRAKFVARCVVEQKDPDQELQVFLDNAMDAGSFWSQVKTNFEAGKIRLLFVADVIPNELRRIVEFLNEQMKSAEVLAVEIKQFEGQGLKTLVPRVIGQSAEAERAKSAGGGAVGKQWNEETFLAELYSKCGKEAQASAQTILAWAKPKAKSIYWGQGSTAGSFAPFFDYYNSDDDSFPSFAVWTTGSVEIYFQHMKNRPVFNTDAKRRELLMKLNSIPGISIPENAIGRRPSFSLDVFRDQNALKMFLESLEWVIQEVQNVRV